MKNSILCLALLCTSAADARAGVILGTSNNPSVQTSGALVLSSNPSASMYVNVHSDNVPNDVMAFWQVSLQIAPITGSGTLMFQNPAGPTAPNPPNYVFGANNIGISATNSGAGLIANDFYFDSTFATSGAVVPATLANLLQLNFSAAPGTSGLFGIYAVPGDPTGTYWTDNTATDQAFENVPLTGSNVLIGEVNVITPVPEPSSLTLLGVGSALLLGYYRRRRTLLEYSL